MKGRYGGCRMTIYGHILPGAVAVARNALLAGKLTERAKQRLKVVDWCRQHKNNISLTARHFSLDRETIRIWQRRLRQEGPVSLNDRSHRPHCLRQPTTSQDIIWAVIKLRKQYPAWSKYKLRVLLVRQGLKTSASTIGRILKRKGLIDRKVSQKRKRSALHPKARFPRGMKISRPGDMVQIDVKYIMLPGGKRFYQFTAIDVLSKKRALRVYASESSLNGQRFLDECIREFSFPIRAIQTDNGSTFGKYFAKQCQQLKIPHFFIYPRTPKQNSYVEISHQADKREFYLQGKVCPILEVMRQRIRERQNEWNKIRPHEALNQLTPEEFLNKYQQGRIPTKNIITLQT